MTNSEYSIDKNQPLQSTLKEKEILVSVIMPTHNSSAFVGESIASVQGQTVSAWELLIIDDHSSDSSVSVVKCYAQNDPRIKLIQLASNKGAAVARNMGIEVAKGRYIAFLDSDDQWLPEKLEKQLDFMQQNQYVFSFSAYQRIDEQGRSMNIVGVPSKVSYQQLLKTSVIGCLTAMYDTAYFGKVTMPLIRKRQDYGLWLKLLKQTDYAYGMPQVLALYRVCSDSISSNKLNTATYNWKLYREIEKLSLLKSCYYFSHYAIKGLLRSKLPLLAKRLGIMD